MIGITIGVLGVFMSIFIMLSGFYDFKTEAFGDITNGYIDREDYSFRGKYKRADGN